MSASRPEASVIIPCKNAGRYLDALLKTLLSQKTSFEYEILFLDSGSTDGTREKLQACSDARLRLLNIPPQDFAHGRTRNEGIRQSRGRFAVMLVQDALPASETWLEEIIRPFKNPLVAGVFCRQIPREDSGFLVKRNLNIWVTASMTPQIKSLAGKEAFENLTPDERAQVCYFDNVCSALRREVWEKIPFDDVPFAEDQRWGKQALLSGHHIAYEPGAAVIHSHDRSALYHFKRVCLHQCMAYENFGRNTVPSLHIAWKHFYQGSLHNWNYLKTVNGCLKQRLFEMLMVPFYSLAEVSGKYVGVRFFARKGKRPSFRGI